MATRTPTTPRTLRRRPAAATAAPSTQTPSREKMRLNGLWRENHWWCNCEPRRQAVKRKVQKRGANRGRNFWACPAVEGCNFFLWLEEAELRETWTRSPHDEEEAPQQPPKTPTLTQQRLTSYGIQTLPTPAASTGKRKRDALREGQDYLGDVGSDEERELVDLAERSVEKLVGTKLLFDDPDDVGTPSRPVARTLFPPRSNNSTSSTARDGCGSSKKRKTVSFDSSSSLKTPTPVLSPARDPGDASPADQDTTSQELMALLRVGQRIDQSLLASIGQILAASANRTRGLVASRDAIRTTLVEKTAEVARLRAQCAQLEDGRVELNSRITNMKATLMRVYEEN